MKTRLDRTLCAGVLGVALWGAPALADTVILLREESQKVPKEPLRALELTRRLRRAGLYGDGIRVARTALSSARGVPVVTDLLLEVARARLGEGDARAAARECERLDKLDETKRQICMAEAELFRQRGSLALPAADAALARDGSSYDAWVAKGRALAQLGSPAEAEAALRKAMTIRPERSEARVGLAELLFDDGQKEAALTILREARQLAAREPDVLVRLGEYTRDKTEAVTALRAAIEERPSDARAQARLGRLLLDAGDVGGAEQALTRAVALDAGQADWQADIGRVHLARGRADEALASAKAALVIVPNHPGAKLVEANALAARGDIDLAIAGFESATALARRDPLPLIDAARACLQHGRPTTARAFADRATAEFPEWGPGWEVLGDVARAASDLAGARTAYKNALSKPGIDRTEVQKKLAALK